MFFRVPSQLLPYQILHVRNFLCNDGAHLWIHLEILVKTSVWFLYHMECKLSGSHVSSNVHSPVHFPRLCPYSLVLSLVYVPSYVPSHVYLTTNAMDAVPNLKNLI